MITNERLKALRAPCAAATAGLRTLWKRYLVWARGYPEYKMVNGHRVRYEGRMAVNREDAIRANWDLMQKMARPAEALAQIRGESK